MSDYEWEGARLPRTRAIGLLELARARPGPIAEYAALEYPRESVTWLLGRARPRGRPSPEAGAPLAD